MPNAMNVLCCAHQNRVLLMLMGADTEYCRIGLAVVISFVLVMVPRPTLGVIGKIVRVTTRLTMPIAHACPQPGRLACTTLVWNLNC